jgi:release factor glutamine methyltransferase
MTSVAGVVDGAAADLCDAGFSRDEARRDSVVLARGILHWSLADWLARSATEASGTFQTTFKDLVSRRRDREPVAYLLGEKEFYGRLFRVTRDTLVPRPETEGLVDLALAWLKGHPARPEALRIVDVGTGTGCVAISVALEHRGALTVIATDTSGPALEVARDNAVRLGASTVDFKLGSVLAGLTGPFDLIVSNPPYVPARDRDRLQPDVVRFEPAVALFGGDDGLDVIRQLISAARHVLSPEGALMMEIGTDQADQVAGLLNAAGFTSVERHQDLQGIDRIIVAHLAGASL